MPVPKGTQEDGVIAEESPFKDTFNNFFRQIHWYETFLQKVADVNLTVLRRTEKKEIFEAFTLKVYVYWEVLAEDLLVDCLSRDTAQYAASTGANVCKSLQRDECRQLITGLGYFDFRDTKDLQSTAKNILADKYNPFKRIPNYDAHKIDEFYIIRNYLAHYSHKSRQALLKMYRNRYHLNEFSEPRDFLFAFDRKTKKRRFFGYLKAFFDSADQMLTFLGG